MHWTRIALILLVCAPVATAAPSGDAPAGPTTIYGLELGSTPERDRLLVFARDALGHRVVEDGPEALILAFPGARLDPSAPRQLRPELGAAISLVNAYELGDADSPEVRLVIRRAAGLTPEISARGAQLAVDFPRPAPERRSLTLRFDRAEIADVVRAVGDATGQAFLFDTEKLKGEVTIFVADRIEAREAIEILEAALLLKGFVALPTPGGPLRIVEVEAGAATAPFRPPAGDDDAPITTLVRLAAASAEQIVPALQPWVGSSAQALAYPPTNSIILAGSENRLQTLLTLIRALDEAAVEGLIVRRLRHHRAEELAPLLETALGGAAGHVDGFAVWPEPQSNALILRGSEELLEEARQWIDEIDQPRKGLGAVRVHGVRYADPDQLARILQDLAGGAPAEGAPPEVSGSLAGQVFGVVVDAPTASLILTGAPTTLDVVEEVIDELDLAPPSVTVEVLVHEITTSDGLSLGIDAFIPISNPNSVDDPRSALVFNPSGGGLVNPGPDQQDAFAFRYTRAPLVFPIVDADGNPASVIVPRESVVVTADDRVIESRVLLRPHLLMLSGDEQEIFAGDNIPIPIRTAATPDVAAGSSLDVRQDIQRQDVGVSVRLKPSVGQEGGVILGLQVEASRVAPSQAGDPHEVGVTLKQRTLDTTVRLQPGTFVVVGTGTERALRTRETSTPFLRDIPVLRQLVSATDEQWVNTSLVIAVQARVHRSHAEQVADSIRRRIGFARSQSRTRDIVRGGGEPYAVLVDTRTSEAEADAIVGRFVADGRPAAVGRWDDFGRERFDVYLTGFHSLAEAGAESVDLVREGWVPQVVVLPGARPRPPAS